jgi:hypothetical protein
MVISNCRYRLFPIDFVNPASDHRPWRWGGIREFPTTFSLPAPLAIERKYAMTTTTIGLQLTEEEVLAFEVSDQALEAAAGSTNEHMNYTLGACTGLSVCPG